MRLRRQNGTKLALAAGAAALFGAFFALVRSEPLKAAVTAPTQAASAPDYDRFFQPNAPVASKPLAAPQAAPAPHTRTRAS